MIGRFLKQENKTYRNMQIVFTLVALNFLIPSFSYFFAPKLAFEQFKQIGAILGAPSYPFAEDGHLWRVLAAGNVFTLGFTVVLLQLDIRRFAGAIPVFVVLKGYSALGYLYVWAFELRYPVFLAVFFLDASMVAIVAGLGGRARRSLDGPGAVPDDRLVPRPLFSRAA